MLHNDYNKGLDVAPADRAVLVVMELHLQRADRAATLREWRSKFAPIMAKANIFKGPDWYRGALWGPYDQRPPRVTREHLRAQAAREFRFANRAHGPIILDDGYACCGMEDARAEAQADARAHGRDLALALRVL